MAKNKNRPSIVCSLEHREDPPPDQLQAWRRLFQLLTSPAKEELKP